MPATGPCKQMKSHLWGADSTQNHVQRWYSAGSGELVSEIASGTAHPPRLSTVLFRHVFETGRMHGKCAREKSACTEDWAHPWKACAEGTHAKQASGEPMITKYETHTPDHVPSGLWKIFTDHRSTPYPKQQRAGFFLSQNMDGRTRECSFTVILEHPDLEQSDRRKTTAWYQITCHFILA